MDKASSSSWKGRCALGAWCAVTWASSVRLPQFYRLLLPLSLPRRPLLRRPFRHLCSTGYITKDLLKQHMPAPGDDSLVLVCGPPPMMKVRYSCKRGWTGAASMDN